MYSFAGSDSVGGGGGGVVAANFSRSQINRIPSVPAHFWYIFGPAAFVDRFDDTHGN